MKHKLYLGVLITAMITCTAYAGLGPAPLPPWEPDAQTKVGWEFMDPTNPVDPLLPGWDRVPPAIVPPAWDYDPQRFINNDPAYWYTRIPNIPSGPDSYKLFWLSYVYERDPYYEGIRTYTNIDWFPADSYDNFDFAGEWFDINGRPTTNHLDAVYGRIMFTLTMYPNPDYEDIWIGIAPDGYYLREAYVITQCIPEPATLAMVAIGCLALLRRR